MKTSVKSKSTSQTVSTNNSPVYFPLSNLFISLGNVRKKSPTGIEELAAMIEAQGLLNPLYVTAENTDSGPTGRYAVEAGGRRFAALKLLARQGRIDPSHSIECRLVDESKALEISLTENISQEGMHPSDEFEAYQSLALKGNSIDAICTKFGVTAFHVQRRLKMANVAPELIELYRQDEITLDHIMAFASTDDQARQLLVWNGLNEYNRSASHIKHFLNESEVSIKDPRVQLVGLDFYIAAGGTMRTDLFCANNSDFITDPVLLDELVSKKIKQEQDLAISEGWAWVEFFPSLGYQIRQNYVFPRKVYSPETPEYSAKLLVITEKIDNLNGKIEELQGEELDHWELLRHLGNQVEVFEDEIETLKDTRLICDYDKSSSGIIICFEYEHLVFHRGIVRKGDQNSVDGSTGQENTSGKARSEVPEKLMMNLSSHRTAAIQALMLKHPNVALAAAADKMAQAIFHGRGKTPIKLGLMDCRYSLEKNAPTLSDSKAAMELDDAHASWVNRLSMDSGSWLEWFLSEPVSTSLEMIVFATSKSVDVIETDFSQGDPAKTLAGALSLDMADWWSPTPEAYLELVPKAKLIEAVTEAAGAVVALDMGKMKKGEAVAFAAQQLKDRRWLPVALRTRVAAATVSDDLNAEGGDDQGDDLSD